MNHLFFDQLYGFWRSDFWQSEWFPFNIHIYENKILSGKTKQKLKNKNSFLLLFTRFPFFGFTKVTSSMFSTRTCSTCPHQRPIALSFGRTGPSGSHRLLQHSFPTFSRNWHLIWSRISYKTKYQQVIILFTTDGYHFRTKYQQVINLFTTAGYHEIPTNC
jgi:hypothetical protein